MFEKQKRKKKEKGKEVEYNHIQDKRAWILSLACTAHVFFLTHILKSNKFRPNARSLY